MNITKWQEMKNMDINMIDSSKLIDSRDIKIDTGLAKNDRIKDYINQMGGNPYFYKYGIYTVKESFSDTDLTMNDLLESFW